MRSRVHYFAPQWSCHYSRHARRKLFRGHQSHQRRSSANQLTALVCDRPVFMASSMQIQPFTDIVEESLDEAQFLWGRWENELTSLTRNLDEVVSWTEDRLLGALDGVRVAPESLFESMSATALAGDDLNRVTVAAHLLAAAKTPTAISLLCEFVRQATGAKL